MPTLAPKLPYTHPFAGGYPRLGGQPLPSDPDAIDYLNRVAAADGAAVEVGVAMAVDAFVRGCKADGIWSAIKASCLLCGPRTLSGALVPLVGTAPTSYAFASGDYNRVTGLKGDGSTTYLDSGRANNADGQNDMHLAAYVSAAATGNTYAIGSNDGGSVHSLTGIGYWCRTASGETGTPPAIGLHAITRSESSGFQYMKASGGVLESTKTSASITVQRNAFVFAYNAGYLASATDARLAFYSIGSALSLESLDTRISAYVAAIAAAL